MTGRKKQALASTTLACGEMRFVLEPAPQVRSVNQEMLEIMGGDLRDEKWIEAVKNDIYLFLPVDEVSLFRECCAKARAEHVPVYLEHHILGYRRSKTNVHSWISWLPEAEEFLLVAVADRDMRWETEERFQQVIMGLFEDVFMVDLEQDTMRMLKEKTPIGLNIKIGVSFRDFRKYVVQDCVHPDDREKVEAYVDRMLDPDIQESADNDLPRIQYRAHNPRGARRRWFELVIFQVRPGRHVFCFSDVTQIKEVEKLRKRLDTDPLTGIMNREAFEAMCNSRRTEARYANALNMMMLIDVDHFYEYTLETQKAILQETARQLERVMRAQDVYARFGDKTFILCLHELTNEEMFHRAALHIQDELRKLRVGMTEVSFSIGYSVCRHDQRQGYRCAYEEAAKALKQAMDDGGNCARLYTGLTDAEKTGVERRHEVVIRTFGFFEIFVDGTPVLFKNQKAKELLAILVDRRGGFISAGEAISYLWEDEAVTTATNTRYRKAAMQLNNTLKEYGVDYIVENADRQRRLVVDSVDCDLYRFLDGDESSIKTFDGAYMMNYSWAEVTAATLVNMAAKN
jgi:diguanylate cyclase (GGDEF)-like protein